MAGVTLGRRRDVGRRLAERICAVVTGGAASGRGRSCSGMIERCCRPSDGGVVAGIALGRGGRMGWRLDLAPDDSFAPGGMPRNWYGRCCGDSDKWFPPQVVHVAYLIAKGIQGGLPIADMLGEISPDLLERLHLDKEWFEEKGEIFDLLMDESFALV